MTESNTQHHAQLPEAIRQRYATAANRVSLEPNWAKTALTVIRPSGCCDATDATCSCANDGRLVRAFVRATKPGVELVAERSTFRVQFQPSAAALAARSAYGVTRRWR